ncbi:unnamed protein product [Cuscuta epithymum]|uniref:Uncharacterized protein n=1 Tax=Cuscuta epithymum TaxID=186058 RepID=A0AAV0DSH5_9ASTE|nr:unnamed protein product [Cuscuta epithymum]
MTLIAQSAQPKLLSIQGRVSLRSTYLFSYLGRIGRPDHLSYSPLPVLIPHTRWWWITDSVNSSNICARSALVVGIKLHHCVNLGERTSSIQLAPESCRILVSRQWSPRHSLNPSPMISFLLIFFFFCY